MTIAEDTGAAAGRSSAQAMEDEGSGASTVSSAGHTDVMAPFASPHPSSTATPVAPASQTPLGRRSTLEVAPSPTGHATLLLPQPQQSSSIDRDAAVEGGVPARDPGTAQRRASATPVSPMLPMLMTHAGLAQRAMQNAEAAAAARGSVSSDATSRSRCSRSSFEYTSASDSANSGNASSRASGQAASGRGSREDFELRFDMLGQPPMPPIGEWGNTPFDLAQDVAQLAPKPSRMDEDDADDDEEDAADEGAM